MYGEIYYHDYCEPKTDKDCTVSILKKDYAGPSFSYEAGVVPFIKGLVAEDSDLVGGVYPTMAKLRMVADANLNLESLYSDDDSTFVVQHIIDGELDWVGFLSTDETGEVENGGVKFLEVNAFDGLTKLKDARFNDPTTNLPYGADPAPEMTLIKVIKEALKKTGIEGLEIYSLVDRVAHLGNITGKKKFRLSRIGSAGDSYTSPGFEAEVPTNIAVGNYVIYNLINQNATYTSKIVSVQGSSLVPYSIALDPPMPPEWGDIFNVEMAFTGVGKDSTKDVLALATLNTRIWIDPEDKKKSDEGNEQEPYYLNPDLAFYTWDVLEDIAKSFDVRISQDRGKWIIEALDINRIPAEQYFVYDPEGDFLRREAQRPVVAIPACVDDNFYRVAGNNRFYKNAMKKVTVNYEYRGKTEHDLLLNKLGLFGLFLTPVGDYPPETFVPDMWTRSNGGINFLVNREYPVANHIEISTTNNSFNDNSYIKTRVPGFKKGDILKMTWEQSLWEPPMALNIFNGVFGLYTIKLVSDEGKVFYLVNSSDDRETESGVAGSWAFMPSKVKGRWEEGKDSEPLHFMTNHSTAHNTASGTIQWSPMSLVEVVSDEAPMGGTIEFYINGSVSRNWPNVNDYPPVRGYVPKIYDYDPDTDGNKVTYVDNEGVPKEYAVTWRSSQAPQPAVRVNAVSIYFILGEGEGQGRVYEYEQEGKYVNSLDPITIRMGDESNPDLLSSIFVGGSVKPIWFTRSAGIQDGPLGLVLARTVMRRYFSPKQRMDGGWGFIPQQLHRMINLEAYPGKVWKIMSGDSNNRDGEFRGSIYEMSQDVLPPGGRDFGPYSLKNDR